MCILMQYQIVVSRISHITISHICHISKLSNVSQIVLVCGSATSVSNGILDSPKSDHCLALSVPLSHHSSLSVELVNLSKLFHGFVKVVTWIFQSCYTNFSMLLLGCFKFDTCISLTWYKDLSKLVLVFLYMEVTKLNSAFGNVYMGHCSFCYNSNTSNTGRCKKMLQFHRFSFLHHPWIHITLWF